MTGESFFLHIHTRCCKGTMINFSVSRPPRALIFSARRKKKNKHCLNRGVRGDRFPPALQSGGCCSWRLFHFTPTWLIIRETCISNVATCKCEKDRLNGYGRLGRDTVPKRIYCVDLHHGVFSWSTVRKLKREKDRSKLNHLLNKFNRQAIFLDCMCEYGYSCFFFRAFFFFFFFRARTRARALVCSLNPDEKQRN